MSGESGGLAAGPDHQQQQQQQFGNSVQKISLSQLYPVSWYYQIFYFSN
jgi:hypothetical protein